MLTETKIETLLSTVFFLPNKVLTHGKINYKKDLQIYALETFIGNLNKNYVVIFLEATVPYIFLSAVKLYKGVVKYWYKMLRCYKYDKQKKRVQTLNAHYFCSRYDL